MGTGACGHSLYILLNFAVTLKLLQIIKTVEKEKSLSYDLMYTANRSSKIVKNKTKQKTHKPEIYLVHSRGVCTPYFGDMRSYKSSLCRVVPEPGLCA